MPVLERSLLCPLLTALVLAGCPGRSPVPDAVPDVTTAVRADASVVQGELPQCDLTGEPRSPEHNGQRVLDCALAEAGLRVAVPVLTVEDPRAAGLLSRAGATLPAAAESFAVVTVEGSTWVLGRDASGAMYGAFELAERLRLDGPAVLPLAQPLVRAPSLAVRAVHPVLMIPQQGETWSSWWLRDRSFWREHLDLLARSRINLYDIHGMWDPHSTWAPNVLLYFARSQSFPQVGVPEQERAANAEALAAVLEMARVRGIRVSLLSYQSDLSVQGPPVPRTLSDAQLVTYSREAVADLARRLPGLWRLGFRIGESGHPPEWYRDTFVAGLRDAGTNTRLETRSWRVDKSSVLALIREAGDTMVEVKFNGEQLGPPYLIAGGSMATLGAWTPYSYADYLDAPTPYTFVFQVMANGTHRVFRYASFERTRRLMPTLALGVSQGFTLAPANDLFPVRDDTHAAPEDRYSPWLFRRDELQYLLFGRLGYDPGTPERVFRAALRERVGTDALWEALQAASDIVPWIQSAVTSGPDGRYFAAELEWGGAVNFWAGPLLQEDHTDASGYRGPFDTFALAPPSDYAEDLARGRPTTRVPPTEVARLVLEDAARARMASLVAVDPANAEARDYVRQCVALADLGTYFGHKLRSAVALALYQRTGRAADLEEARGELSLAHDAWRALATDTSYLRPFVDNLRMRYVLHGHNPRVSIEESQSFHWRDEVPWLAIDSAAVDSLAARVSAAPPSFSGSLAPASELLSARRAEGPGLSALAVDPPDPRAARWTVTATFQRPVPEGSTVRVLWKPFAPWTDWQTVATTGSGNRFEATVPGTHGGGYFAVEVSSPSGGWRYPDVLRETPYVVLAP